MGNLRRKTLAKHPNPPTNPVEALRHALAIYEDESDEMVVFTATRSVYPEAPWTGITLGDLRRISEMLN